MLCPLSRRRTIPGCRIALPSAVMIVNCQYEIHVLQRKRPGAASDAGKDLSIL
jgi:hypothetical protein